MSMLRGPDTLPHLRADEVLIDIVKTKEKLREREQRIHFAVVQPTRFESITE